MDEEFKMDLHLIYDHTGGGGGGGSPAVWSSAQLHMVKIFKNLILLISCLCSTNLCTFYLAVLFF